MKKITIRLAVLISLLSCLPMLIFAVFSYTGISTRVKEREIAYAQQSLQQYSSVIERLLTTTGASMDAFIQSSNLQEAMLLEMTGKDFQVYREISSDLGRLQPVWAMQANACIINMRKGWLINNSGLYRIDEAENWDLYWNYMEQYSSPSIVSFFPGEDKGEWYDSFFSDPAVILIRQISQGIRSDNTGMLLVKLPCVTLNQLLETDNALGEVLVLDENYRVLAGSNARYGETLFDSPVTRGVLADAQRTGNYSLHEDGIEVAYQYSELTGWLYILLKPQSELANEYYKAAIPIIVIFAALMLGILISSTLLSRKTYAPVADIVNTLAKGNVSERGAEPFKYISTGIVHMATRQKALMAQLNQDEQPIREYMTLSLLHGTLTEEMLARWNFFFETIHPTRMKVVLIMQPDPRILQENKKSAGVFMRSFQELVAESLKETYILTPVMDNCDLCLILSYSDEDREAFKTKVKGTANELLDLLGSGEDTYSVVGVSAPFVDLMEAGRAYQEAHRALSQRIYYQYEAILFYSDLMPNRSLHLHQYLHTKEKIIDALKSADGDEAEKLLDELFQEVFTDGLTQSEYIVPLLGLLNELVSMRQDISETFSTRQGGWQSIYDEFLALKSLNEMRGWMLERMIRPYVEDASRLMSTQKRKLVRRINEMIEAEFDKDLTIESCAKTLNYHPAYIRKVFAEVTGMSFGDCLSRRRMEAAKEWLCLTDMQVQEIAARLGYSNSQNFIRSFKAYIGETPGVYRKRTQQ